MLHLDSCRVVRSDGDNIIKKCLVEGCRAGPVDLSCPTGGVQNGSSFIVGHCLSHWLDLCENNRWDFALPCCFNEECDRRKINLTQRQAYTPTYLETALQNDGTIREAGGVKKRLEF